MCSRGRREAGARQGALVAAAGGWRAHFVGRVAELVLDEAQEVLLVHAGAVVNVGVHLAHVVKVAVGDGLLFVRLPLSVQEAVKVEALLEQLEAEPREALDVG